MAIKSWRVKMEPLVIYIAIIIPGSYKKQLTWSTQY